MDNNNEPTLPSVSSHEEEEESTILDELPIPPPSQATHTHVEVLENHAVSNERAAQSALPNTCTQEREAAVRLVKGDPYRIKVMQRQHILVRVNEICTLAQLNDLSLHQLEAKLSVLERQYDAFHNLQSELELMNDHELNRTHRDAFDESFCTAKALLVERMTTAKTTRRDTIFSSTVMPTSQRVNLPKLQLTKFNGQHRDWIDFHNVFLALVHNNTDLADIEKFQYLRSCLVDTAARVIQSLEVTEQNYMKALDLLRWRYDNKRLIFQAHLQHIFEIQENVKSDASSMRCFIDLVNINLRALQSLASRQQISDGTILHLVTSKLDGETKAKWEEDVAHSFDQKSSSTAFYFPDWNDLAKFLERRCQIADILQTGQSSVIKNKPLVLTPSRHTKSEPKWALISTQQTKCEFCKTSPSHNAFRCETFMGLDPLSRYNCVKRLNLCINCLGSGHKSSDCPSLNLCKHCNVKHYTLLHRRSPSNEEQTTDDNPERAVLLSSSDLKVSLNQFNVILGTALIHVFNSRGANIQARALLDSGSQLHFITERLAQYLRVPRKSVDMEVSGIGLSATKTHHLCAVTIKSMHSEYCTTIYAVILPSITSCQPSRRIDTSLLQIPSNIAIADPAFSTPGPVDVLIGAGLFFELLYRDKIQLKGPTLQDTKLGWVVAGAFTSSSSSLLASSTSTSLSSSSPSSSPYKSFVSISPEPALDKLLERFWTMENLPTELSSSLSSNELECEIHFANSTRRCPTTQKFIVRLPFKDNPLTLGNSEDIARK